MTQNLNLDSMPPLHRPSGSYALIYGSAKLRVPVKLFLYRNFYAFTSAEDFLRQPISMSKTCCKVTKHEIKRRRGSPSCGKTTGCPNRNFMKL
jgi:hypothetical protein